MEWILLAVGLVVGAGAGFGVTKIGQGKKNETPIVIKDETAEKQQDVILQLTDLDLVRPICDPVYIKETQSDLLCRELFCRMQQRGIDAQTGASECEAISNIMNKRSIFDFCQDANTVEEVVDHDKAKACIEFFDRRI